MTEPATANDDRLDAVDRIILREATAWLSTVGADQVVVLDDATGDLSVTAAELAGPGRVRVHCDTLADEVRTVAAASAAERSISVVSGLDEALLGGATAVLLRLPKSLAALDELAEAVARYADPEVHLFAGGRVKHMTRGMNRILSTHFTSVAASLGQQKSRVLMASGPRVPARTSYPGCERHEDLDLTVCAHGAAFAGTSVDLGTRFLSSFLDRLPPGAEHVVDLGCGTGVLATLAARQLPGAQVEALDDSAAACRSATATAAANDVAERVTVRRADLLSGVADRSVDLVLCNPPFHRGTSRDSDAAFGMFAAAGRALRPGGELWTVHNSHLPYLPALRRLVGSTQVLGQNPHYLVTRSTVPQREPANRA
jgi:16S rRNA (guanine1207-N2)-methyltransferase